MTTVSLSPSVDIIAERTGDLDDDLGTCDDVTGLVPPTADKDARTVDMELMDADNFDVEPINANDAGSPETPLIG